MRKTLLAFGGLFALLLSFLTPVSPAVAATPASGYWTVAAGGARSVVFAQTTLNTPVLENGAFFYFTDTKSIGFAPNSTIAQTQADTSNQVPCDLGNGDLRLSWHLTGTVGGYRAGCNINPGSEPRAVYQSNSSASLFSGPAKNVAHQTLLDNGWALCYDDAYSTVLSTNGSELTSVCTQTYVLLAGGDGVAGPQPSFSSASTPAASVDEVEAGPPGIALTVPNVPGRIIAGIPIYFGTDRTQSNGAFSLTLTGPQGRAVLASGTSNIFGGYVGMVRLPAGMQQGTHSLTLRNRSAESTPLVLTIILTVDANGILVGHRQG